MSHFALHNIHYVLITLYAVFIILRHSYYNYYNTHRHFSIISRLMIMKELDLKKADLFENKNAWIFLKNAFFSPEKKRTEFHQI